MHIYVYICVYKGLSRKSPAIVSIMRWFPWHPSKLAAKGNGMECECVNRRLHRTTQWGW